MPQHEKSIKDLTTTLKPKELNQDLALLKFEYNKQNKLNKLTPLEVSSAEERTPMMGTRTSPKMSQRSKRKLEGVGDQNLSSK